MSAQRRRHYFSQTCTVLQLCCIRPINLKRFNSNIKLWVAALRLYTSLKQHLFVYFGPHMGEQTYLIQWRLRMSETRRARQKSRIQPQVEREGEFNLKSIKSQDIRVFQKPERKSKPEKLLCETPNGTEQQIKMLATVRSLFGVKREHN